MICNEQPASILIVDDAPSNLVILAESLRAEFDIRVAHDANEALRLVCDCPPDLILLDIIMPGMDGYEVCRQLKAAPSTRHIPIIFLTAKGDVTDETFGLELGAVDYIVKPVNLPIVRARVRTHVELKRRGDILENLSMLDGLTGIPNRRRFDDCLDRAWRQGARNVTPLSVIMADIDCFKSYNDAHGHVAGDDCLRAVAQAIAGTIKRPGDLAARYGGEEFAVVLEDTDLDGALHLAETMRRAVEALGLENFGGCVSGLITISLGAAATVPNCGKSPQSLVASADRKLYEAKVSGRNQVLGEPAL